MSSQEISREGLLALLASIGVVLSQTTKLPDQELNRRLALAFDASQQFTNIITTIPVDLTSSPLWPSDKPLYQATQRWNVSEALGQVMSQSKRGSLSPKEDTFNTLRESASCLGLLRDIGKREICFVDANGGLHGQWGIFIQIIDVYNIKNDIPLFLIKFKELHPNQNQTLSDLLILFNLSEENKLVLISISDLEHRGMLKLFYKNARRLHSKYQEDNEEDKATITMTSWQTSFVLPLCPLSMRDLGSLMKDPGCELCGQKTTKRCSRCLAVSYCTTECQKKDWENHKTVCRSLKGGTWHTISVKEPPNTPPFRRLIYRLGSLRDASTAGIDISSTRKPLENIQNGKIFLAKFQVPFSPQPIDMMIYDRQRSFQAHWYRSTDVNLFDSARNVMGSKMKMYRWIRHINEDEFEICLDRGPTQDPLW